MQAGARGIEDDRIGRLNIAERILDVSEREAFAAELIDRFGPLPAEAEQLIAVAALNPHSGEGGILGTEDDAPAPNDPRWQSWVDRAVIRLLEASAGHALVLFTSYDSLRSSYEAALPRLTELLALYDQIRGFGPVKEAARQRQMARRGQILVTARDVEIQGYADHLGEDAGRTLAEAEGLPPLEDDDEHP